MAQGNVRIVHHCNSCGDTIVTYHSVRDYKKHEIDLTHLLGLCIECGGGATVLEDTN